jgi:hypothetical protein
MVAFDLKGKRMYPIASQRFSSAQPVYFGHVNSRKGRLSATALLLTALASGLGGLTGGKILGERYANDQFYSQLLNRYAHWGDHEHPPHQVQAGPHAEIFIPLPVDLSKGATLFVSYDLQDSEKLPADIKALQGKDREDAVAHLVLKVASQKMESALRAAAFRYDDDADSWKEAARIMENILQRGFYRDPGNSNYIWNVDPAHQEVYSLAKALGDLGIKLHHLNIRFEENHGILGSPASEGFFKWLAQQFKPEFN